MSFNSLKVLFLVSSSTRSQIVMTLVNFNEAIDRQFGTILLLRRGARMERGHRRVLVRHTPRLKGRWFSKSIDWGQEIFDNSDLFLIIGYFLMYSVYIRSVRSY